MFHLQKSYNFSSKLQLLVTICTVFPIVFIILSVNLGFSKDNDIFYFKSQNTTGSRLHEVRSAAKLLGLSMKLLDVSVIYNEDLISDFMDQSVFIIDCNSLDNRMNPRKLKSLLENVSLLGVMINGCSENADKYVMENVLDLNIINPSKKMSDQINLAYMFNDIKSNEELSGQSTNLLLKNVVTINSINPINNTYDSIIEVVDSNDSFPIHVKSIVEPKLHISSSLIPEFIESPSNTHFFTQIAPEVIFLKNTLDDRCFHREFDQANLTIDDPWLINPYGALDYFKLVNEMNEVGFHTTIAFVPWNFSRSVKEIEQLFLNNSYRLSIAVHGNNHDGREFSNPEDLTVKEDFENHYNKDIIQSISRMEEFSRLTKIPYDRVMVFPHGIGPSLIFPIMQKMEFSFTANARYWPSDKPPINSLNSLRSYTDNYNGFGSVRRVSPNATEFSLAIDLFLDNPIIFYTHQWYFFDGINRFNPIANKVNTISPNLEWGSLGNIGDKLYLVRTLRDGSDYIHMFSSKIKIYNPTASTKVFHIFKKIENNESVFALFDEVGNQLDIAENENSSNILANISLEPGQEKSIILKSVGSNIILPSPARNNIGIWILRYGSDFRDLVLSRTKVGQSIVVGLYGKGGSGMRTIIIAIVLFVILLTLIVALLLYRNLRFKIYNSKLT